MDIITQQQEDRIRGEIARKLRVGGPDLGRITGAAMEAARKAPGGWGESRQAWGLLVEAIYEPDKKHRSTRGKAEVLAETALDIVIDAAPQCVHPDQRRQSRQARVGLAMADGAESA